MSSSSSEFCPPRARGFGRFRSIGFAFKRLVYVCPFVISKEASSALFCSLLPGYIFRRLGYPWIAWIVLIAYFAALIVFIVALGFRTGSFAFSAMLAIHSTSALTAYRNVNDDAELGGRFRSALKIVILITLLYFGAQRLLGHVILPLRLKDKIYVVNALASLKNLQRGERVAYEIQETRGAFSRPEAHGTIIVEAGYDLGTVIGLTGDKIEFGKDKFTVNGIAYPRMPGMPESGELVVPENHWLIWSDFAINVQGPAAEVRAQNLLSRMGMVDKKNFVGTIFRRWFWRKQL
jgi:hypothetical protein